MAVSTETLEQVNAITEDGYKHGFVTDIETEKISKGLNEDTIRLISEKKEEPQYLLNFRLNAFRNFYFRGCFFFY